MLETRVLAVLDQLLQKTRFAQFPFLPSYWLSTSVLQWADGALNLAGFFILVLLSNVLFFGFLAFTKLGNFYYEAASRVQKPRERLGTMGMVSRILQTCKILHLSGQLSESAADLLVWVQPDTRALLVKDARMTPGGTRRNGARRCCSSACSAFT